MSRQAEADEKGGNTSRGAGAGPVRVLAGAAGVALMGTGVSLLLDVRDLTGVLVWLGTALAVHDVLIAPLALLAGLALTRVGVGARACTEYGAHMAAHLAAGLADRGWV
ncbi:hypothetical protein ABZ651_30135, partial [Streptomyces sp. NPDC007070]